NGVIVNWEKAHGGAVFRRHIGNGGAIGHGQRSGAFATEFHEFSNDFFTAQHFSQCQYQIGCCDAATQLSGKLHADDVRGQEVNRLTQHGGFRFDTAYAPGDHADTVDHGGVAIGAHQRVWIVHIVFLVNAPRQVFQVDLVHDAEAGRHHAEGIEGLHAPFHE